jgi:hypothetical protein
MTKKRASASLLDSGARCLDRPAFYNGNSLYRILLCLPCFDWRVSAASHQANGKRREPRRFTSFVIVETATRLVRLKA